MPRDERVITVLVASPSDLEPERSRLEEVVRELNVTWSKSLRIRLDLVRWETHGYPGVGEDAQDVLNRELGDDYDIFLGMMWGKYGTPTGRAGSGTEEEFRRALARYQRDATSVKIMFYFKDTPLAPSKINPEELSKVQQFKSSLGEEGTLYWPFSSIEDFERLVRLHLARQVQEFMKTHQPTQAALPPESEKIAAVANNEPGLLDLMEIAEERFAALTETTERMASETNNLGERMQERTDEINTAMARTGGKLSPKEAKALISRAAADMNQYVLRIRSELPLFRDGLREGTDAVVGASLMSIDLSPSDRKQAHEAREGIAALEKVLHNTSDSVTSFREIVRGLPRMTSTLNKAKRETAIVLDEVIESLGTGRRLLLEAIKGLNEL